jgi:arabinofuranosyltransferase
LNKHENGVGWPPVDILLLALAAGLASGLFVAAEHHLAGAAGFPLDDAYIHLQMARNIVEGGGFSFNAGEPVAASTAPLWTLCVALLYALPVDIVVSIKSAGALLLFVCGLLTHVMGRAVGLGRQGALLAALAVALTPRLLWAAPSGMEVLLYTALATAGLGLHVLRFDTKPSYVSTALFAGAALARPECLILFPLAILDRWRRDRALLSLVGLYKTHVVLYVTLLAPFAFFNAQYGSGVLPNTFYAKVGSYGLMGALAEGAWLRVGAALTLYPLEQGVELVQFAAENNLLLALLVPLGLLQVLKKREGSWLVVLVLVVFPIARGILAPFKGPTFQHGRYAAFLTPLLAVLGVVGARVAWQVLVEGWMLEIAHRWRQKAVWVLAILTLGSALVAGADYMRTYAANVADINQMHVEMGRWLRVNTAEDAVVATNDIGAIAYYSERRILDIVGLASPQTLAYLKAGVEADQGVLRLLMDQRPDYLVVLPNWYPQIAQMRHLFEPLYEIEISGATIAGGNRLVAYRTIWAD